MAKLERGMVDPDRSILWNLWHYRTTDETRCWSLAHHDMWNIVMALRTIIILFVTIMSLALFPLFVEFIRGLQ